MIYSIFCIRLAHGPILKIHGVQLEGTKTINIALGLKTSFFDFRPDQRFQCFLFFLNADQTHL